MATPIIMPKFGQMTEESAIVEWLKKEGDKVAKGDILFTVETDKSVMEVESFEEGTLLKIVVQPGVNVPVQSTVGFLGKPGEAIPTVAAPAPAAPKPAAAEVGRAVSTAPPPPTSVARPAEPALLPQLHLLPPRCRQPCALPHQPASAALARSCVIDPSPIKGSGPQGRVVERDVEQYLESRATTNCASALPRRNSPGRKVWIC